MAILGFIYRRPDMFVDLALTYALLETLHDHRFMTEGRPQLRKSKDDAEPQKQREDEQRTGGEGLQKADAQTDEVGRRHTPVSML